MTIFSSGKKDMAAWFSRPGYWLTPDGRILPVSGTHIAYVIDHPEIFGYTRNQLKSAYALTEERFRMEGRAREAIIRELVLKGFVRIRRYRRHWSVTVADWSSPVVNNVERFAYRILYEGISGSKERDQEISVRVTSVLSDTVICAVPIHELAAHCGETRSGTSTATSETATPASSTTRSASHVMGMFEAFYYRMKKLLGGLCSRIFGAHMKRRHLSKWIIKQVGLNPTVAIAAPDPVAAAIRYLHIRDAERMAPETVEILIVENTKGQKSYIRVTRIARYTYSGEKL